MDNNKNLMKTENKSNAELRKMFPKDGSDIGGRKDDRIIPPHEEDKRINKQQGQALKNTTTRN